MTTGSAGAPGTGAVSGGGAGSGDVNSGAVNYATTTDDQILDTTDEDTEDAGEGTQGEPEVVSIDDDNQVAEPADGAEREGNEGDEEEAEGKDGEEGEEDEVEELGEEAADTPDPADDPADLKAAFKSHPQLREAYYRDQAYRQEFPTVAEAREYKELAPTLDALKTSVQNSEQLENFDQTYFSTNPADHTRFFQTLHEQDPNQFAIVMRQAPSALYELDPNLYREVVAEPAVRNTLANMYNLAVQRGLGEGKAGQNLANAIDVVSMALFQKRYAELGPAGTQKSAREIELERQLAGRTQADSQAKTQQFQEFHGKTNDAAVTKILDGIKLALLGKKNGLLKDTAHLKNQEAVNRMVGEIYNKVDAVIKADRSLTRDLRQIFHDPQGRFDQAHIDRVVAKVVERANAEIRRHAPAVVTTWTKKLLRDNARQQTTQRRAAARPDVTGAAGAGQGRAAGTRIDATKIDYGKTSDDDILEGKVRLRK